MGVMYSQFGPTAIGSTRGVRLILACGAALLFLSLALAAAKGTLLLWLLAAIVGLLGVAFLTQKPYLGVLVLLVFWLLQRSPLFAVIRPLQLQYLIGVVLLIPLGLAVFRDRGIWILQIPQIKYFLAIGALFLVSTWWNNLIRPDALVPELDETIPWTRAFVVLFAFLVFFLYFVDTRRKIEVAAWFIIGLIAVSALSAILPLIQGEEVGRVRAEFGIAENSNRLAYMCLFAASMAWFYYSHGTGWLRKSVVLPAFFGFAATALASGSRSGFLQLLLLGALILKEQKNWSATKRLQGVLLVGALVVALLAIVPAAQFTRMTTFSSAAAAKSVGGKSMRDRLRTIYSAVELAASNPVLGVGLGNFIWIHKAYYGIENATHNSYLWMLTEGGVGVLILYLMLFHATYRMLRELETRGPPEFLWLSKALRVNMVLFMIFTAFANFWISIFVYLIVGLTLCMARVWHESALGGTAPRHAVAATVVAV